jgi:hypothetical protein
MTNKIVSLSISLLLASALAVMAQSPTTSAPPGGGATHDPYGATMDHPNPSSATAGNTVTTTPQNGSADTSATTGSNNNNTDNSATPTATSNNDNTSTTTTTTSTTDTSSNTTPSTLPKTASDLPLFAAMGFLALAGACVMRASARQRG